MTQFEKDLTHFLRPGKNQLVIYVRSESLASGISKISHYAKHQIISKDVMYDDAKTIALQNTLNNTPNAGTDIERIVKTRVSQGSFRRLLLLERHHCNLCNIGITCKSH